MKYYFAAAIFSITLMIMPLTFSFTNSCDVPVWIDKNRNNVLDKPDWTGNSLKLALENASDGDIIYVEKNLTEDQQICITKSVTVIGKNVSIDVDSECAFEIKSNNVTIEGFVLEKSYRFAIHSEDFSNITLRNNFIQNCEEGIGIYRGRDIIICGNSIANCGFGVFVGLSQNVELRGNKFNGCGISIQASDVKIYNNTMGNLISTTWAGIHCMALDGNLSLKVENNTISNNTCGLFFYCESGFEVEADIHFNKIAGNKRWGLLNLCNRVINATYNYWGSNDGPRYNGSGSGDNVSSNVIFYPWLIYEEDKEPCTSILRPKNGLYILDRKICKIKRTIILGYVTVRVNATDDHGIDRVEVFINDEKRCAIKSPPYEWLWNEKAIGKRRIKVITYDTNGKSSSDELDVFIVNPGLMRWNQRCSR
ncbi:MAG: hypothetical protein DRN18_03000 [Thermoplasmata archaeon]|nr:MAG: hypothetical protein DRN18_03000 [Thermoplasmata archaeon]